MPNSSNEYKKNIAKEFWKFLSTERLRPTTKHELRAVYYDKFKKMLDKSTGSVPFSIIMFHLKRMKKVVKSKDGSETLLYFERKGRRLVLAVDQSFVQRRQRSALKEKEQDEKDVDESEKEKGLPEQENYVQQLKKIFIKHMKMPNASNEYKKNIAKEFWKFLSTERLRPTTKHELRAVYYDKFKKMLDKSTGSVPFSIIMFHLKRMKKVVKSKDGSETLLYFERKGRRLVLAVDQSFVQRRQRSALKEKEQDEKDVDESEKEKGLPEQENYVQQLKKIFIKHMDKFVQDKGGIRISCDLDRPHGVIDFGGMQLTESAKITEIVVTNAGSSVVKLKRFVALSTVSQFILSDKHGVTKDGKKLVVIKIPTGKSCTISALFKPNNLGDFRQIIVFEFEEDTPDSEPYYIVRHLIGQGINNDVKSLLPTQKYQHPAAVARVVDPDITIIGGIPPLRPDTKLCHTVPLENYHIPFDLRLGLNQGKPNGELVSLLELEPGLQVPEYSRKFASLLHIEELQMEVDIRHYDVEDATLSPDGQFLVLKVPELAENRPSVIKGDQILVRLKDAEGKPLKEEYQGFVHMVGLNDVWLKFSPSFHEKYIKGMTVNARFTFNRTPLKLMHRALQIGIKMMEERKLVSLQMAVGSHLGPLLDDKKRDSLRFFDVKLHSNKEQEQAVKNIVSGTSRPIPYLLFGPPGTGKTVTIVESIKQILAVASGSHVLACAPSNSAADLILQRVMEHAVVPKSQMIRLNSFGRSLFSVPDDIKSVSCITRGGDFFFPSKEEITEKRLVVTTLITAGRLVSAGIPENFFTHVFIDEAGHALQPECFIPLAGMFSTETPGGGQLVLAGDPQQLGPVLRSPVATKYGLGVSLLEWMMTKLPFYGRIPEDEDDELGEYNALIITKLLKNYRSHPSILELPNEMFYDDELEACADQLKRESLCNWSRLPCKGFPIIFEGIKGRDMREEKSPSFFNPEEAATVIQYVKDLRDARGIKVFTSQIGIISPYSKQVQKIQELLKRSDITDVKTGSVEEFQGQERRVIIISTVRSSQEYLHLDAEFRLGFLKNPKRFNVAITRAQALLIVVGNPYVLCKDRHWNRFIQFCISSKGYKGCDFKLPSQDDEDLIARLKRVHLDSKESIEAVESLTDDVAKQHK